MELTMRYIYAGFVYVPGDQLIELLEFADYLKLAGIGRYEEKPKVKLSNSKMFWTSYFVMSKILLCNMLSKIKAQATLQ